MATPEVESLPFICPLCPASFDDESKLDSHFILLHRMHMMWDDLFSGFVDSDEDGQDDQGDSHDDAA